MKKKVKDITFKDYLNECRKNENCNDCLLCCICGHIATMTEADLEKELEING